VESQAWRLGCSRRRSIVQGGCGTLSSWDAHERAQHAEKKAKSLLAAAAFFFSLV
jgi:hypothetical protein